MFCKSFIFDMAKRDMMFDSDDAWMSESYDSTDRTPPDPKRVRLILIVIIVLFIIYGIWIR